MASTTYVIQRISYATKDWADSGSPFDDEQEARENLQSLRENVAEIGPFRLIARTESVLDE